MSSKSVLRELIEAARPFAGPKPQPDWLCHGSDPQKFATCANCNRFVRLRDAIRMAEEALS